MTFHLILTRHFREIIFFPGVVKNRRARCSNFGYKIKRQTCVLSRFFSFLQFKSYVCKISQQKFVRIVMHCMLKKLNTFNLYKQLQQSICVGCSPIMKVKHYWDWLVLGWVTRLRLQERLRCGDVERGFEPRSRQSFLTVPTFLQEDPGIEPTTLSI